MGSTDPELPRPGRGRRAICNLARTILDPYVQNGQIVDAGEDRGEANAGDDTETPNPAAGPRFVRRHFAAHFDLLTASDPHPEVYECMDTTPDAWMSFIN
jgi:hypothetical protein